MGIHNNIVKLIENLYAGQQAAVRLECGMSDWFSVSKGVRQGCILSPHLFSLYTEGIMREVEQDPRKDLYSEPNIQGLKIRDLRYADDIIINDNRGSAPTDTLSQRTVKEHSENKGLFLNIKKTKIVDTDRCKRTSDITVDGEKVKCLENFEYLGSKIEGNRKCSNEIKRRTAMA
ncbi:LINE-1 reverse transcriptase homolog, partial [Elysia marginata]